MDERDDRSSAPRATIKTIADLTGLSPSTVSLSLRGGERLSEETIRKVAEAAASVGYIPDRAGVRLRTGKTNVISLVLDGNEDSVDFARHLIQGIGHAISATNYNLNVTPAFDRSKSLEIVGNIVGHRAADGIIITHTSKNDPRVEMLLKAGFPFVTHGRTGADSGHAYYDFDSCGFVRLAAERLLSKRRSRLLLIVGDNKTQNYLNMVREFQEVTRQAGIDGRVLEEEHSSLRPLEMRRYGAELAATEGRPDGIICNSEVRAGAIAAGLQSCGLSLGRDVDVIYKQTSDLVPLFLPELDSVVEDVFAAGQELARFLLKRINGFPVSEAQALGDPRPVWRT